MLLALSFVSVAAASPSAEALPDAPELPSAGVALDLYFDDSRSNRGRAADDLALATHLAFGLRDGDLLGMSTFGGEVRSLLPLGAPSVDAIGPVLKGLPYASLHTFYSPVLFDIYARNASVGPRSHVAVIVTDADGSDPTNKRRKNRPTVADPTWTVPPVASLGEARVIWLVRGAPPETVGEGAVAATITEPTGLASTAVMWNPPTSAWSAPGPDLASWIEAFRPEPPPVVETPPPEPPFDWGPVLRWTSYGASALVLVGVGLYALRKAREAAQVATARREQRRTDEAIQRERRSQLSLTLEPLAIAGKPEARTVRANDIVECGRHALPPGIPWAFPSGAGFLLEVGHDPQEVRVRPRSARCTLVIAREGAEPIGVEPDAPPLLRDGDVLVDARTDTQLARVRFAEPGARTLRRIA